MSLGFSFHVLKVILYMAKKKKKYNVMKSKALFHFRPSVPSPETNAAESFLYPFQKLHMHLQALCFIVEKTIPHSAHCHYPLCLTSCHHQYIGMDFIIMRLSRGSLSTGNTLYLTNRQVHCFSLSQLEKKIAIMEILVLSYLHAY